MFATSVVHMIVLDSIMPFLCFLCHHMVTVVTNKEEGTAATNTNGVLYTNVGEQWVNEGLTGGWSPVTFQRPTKSHKASSYVEWIELTMLRVL